MGISQDCHNDMLFVPYIATSVAQLSTTKTFISNYKEASALYDGQNYSERILATQSLYVNIIKW